MPLARRPPRSACCFRPSPDRPASSLEHEQEADAAGSFSYRESERDDDWIADPGKG
jgi:hypothetical protein